MTNKSIKKETFAKRLKKIMNDNNETIYTISEIIDLSPATISRYINKIMAPKTTTVQILAQHYNINPVWLMGYDVEKDLVIQKLTQNEMKLIEKYRQLSKSKKQYIQGQLQTTLDLDINNKTEKRGTG